MNKARHDAVLALHGEAMTLTRGATSVVVRGKVYRAAESDLAGALPQQERHVRIGTAEILAASWPAPPVKGDRLVIAGKTHLVQSVDTRSDGSTVWGYFLKVKG